MDASDAPQWRMSLMKGRHVQASVRMGAEGVKKSMLSSTDEGQVLSLQKGASFTDADGDRWERTR